MADDIYFNKYKKNSDKPKNKIYTEKIDQNVLDSKPGNHSFNNIRTDNTYIKAQNMSKSNNKNVKKKKSNSKIILKTVCLLLCICLVLPSLLIGFSGIYVLSNYTCSEYNNELTDDTALLHSPYVKNILLMGIDNKNTEASTRSDAMILMSIDSLHGKIKLTSFLRDSYVTIPGHYKTKLNAACVYGGPQLACDTIEYNFGINIDGYAKIGYDIFIELVDAVGGITIPEIDEVEVSALAKEGFNIEPGKNIKLNGYQALLYCRIRKGQNDFYRTERQREVITLIIKKALSSNPIKLVSAAKDIASKIECSIDKKDIFSLVIKIIPCLFSKIEQFRIPADNTWYNDTINSQAVLVIDFEKNKELINNFIYE